MMDIAVSTENLLAALRLTPVGDAAIAVNTKDATPLFSMIITGSDLYTHFASTHASTCVVPLSEPVADGDTVLAVATMGYSEVIRFQSILKNAGNMTGIRFRDKTILISSQPVSATLPIEFIFQEEKPADPTVAYASLIVNAMINQKKYRAEFTGTASDILSGIYAAEPPVSSATGTTDFQRYLRLRVTDHIVMSGYSPTALTHVRVPLHDSTCDDNVLIVPDTLRAALAAVTDKNVPLHFRIPFKGAYMDTLYGADEAKFFFRLPIIQGDNQIIRAMGMVENIIAQLDGQPETVFTVNTRELSKAYSATKLSFSGRDSTVSFENTTTACILIGRDGVAKLSQTVPIAITQDNCPAAHQVFMFPTRPNFVNEIKKTANVYGSSPEVEIRMRELALENMAQGVAPKVFYTVTMPGYCLHTMLETP